MKALVALLSLALAASLGCAPNYVGFPQEAMAGNDIDWRIESPPATTPAAPAPTPKPRP